MSVIVPNSDVGKIRLVEFLPNEEERDHAIIAFEVHTKSKVTPIVLGGVPAHGRWCYHLTLYQDDPDGTVTGRWLLPDGTQFDAITDVRTHFGTRFQTPPNPVTVRPSGARTLRRRYP